MSSYYAEPPFLREQREREQRKERRELLERLEKWPSIGDVLFIEVVLAFCAFWIVALVLWAKLDDVAAKIYVGLLLVIGGFVLGAFLAPRTQLRKIKQALEERDSDV